MECYIGAKIVHAEPQARDDQGPIELGRETVGPVRAGYKVIYEDGYTSWSPKDVFERCYRRVTAAEAILVLGTPYLSE